MLTYANLISLLVEQESRPGNDDAFSLTVVKMGEYVPPPQVPDQWIASQIVLNAQTFAGQARARLLLDPRCNQHLLYLLFPVVRRLNSWNDFARWKDDVGPIDMGLGLLDGWDAWIRVVVGTLTRSMADNASLRGVATPTSLYAEIRRHPFLVKTLGVKLNYSPLYRIRTANGEEGELSLSDELLAGIMASSDNTVVQEIHPAYSSLSYPEGIVPDLNEEGIVEVRDALLERYNSDTPYPPYFYSGVIASNPPLDYTFDSDEFIQGVATAALWSGVTVDQLLSEVRDNRTGQELAVQ